MTHSKKFSGEVEFTVCPICESDRVMYYRESRDRHYGIPGTFQTAKCESCGLVYLDPMLTVPALAGLYPENYYSYQSPKVPAGPNVLIKRILRLERVTLTPKFIRPGVLLDVGCGAGHYLFGMRARGWQVHGSELSKAGAEAGRSVGLDIRDGELMQAEFPERMFDFVRANHSLEHMPNPRQVLLEMHRLLKDDGVLVIGVPNIDGLLARVFGEYWWNFGVPVHTYNFNPENLALLLKQCGFKVEKIRHYSDFSSLLGSIQIFVNRKTRTGDSKGKILQSWLLRLPAQLLVRTIDFFRLGDCIEVQCKKIVAP